MLMNARNADKHWSFATFYVGM